MLDLLQSGDGLQGEHVEGHHAAVPQHQQVVEKRECPELRYLVARAQFSGPAFSARRTQVAGKDEVLDGCVFGPYVEVAVVALEALDA